MLVIGFDDRTGRGYVLRSGPHTAAAEGLVVSAGGYSVLATPELALLLRDALDHHPVASLGWGGPEVPLTLDDTVLLGWLRHTVGGVITIEGAPEG